MPLGHRQPRPHPAFFAIFMAAALPMPAMADFSLGIAYESLSYSQSNVNSLRDSAIQLREDFAKYSGRWELHASGNVTLLPLANGSQPDFHGIDFDALGGLALLGRSRNRLSVLEGVGSSTLLISSPSMVGYENAVFEESGLWLAHLLKNGGQFDVQARLMYQLNSGGGSRGEGLGGDLRYTFKARARHPFSLLLEGRTLKILAGGASATANTLSAGMAMGL